MTKLSSYCRTLFSTGTKCQWTRSSSCDFHRFDMRSTPSQRLKAFFWYSLSGSLWCSSRVLPSNLYLHTGYGEWHVVQSCATDVDHNLGIKSIRVHTVAVSFRGSCQFLQVCASIPLLLVVTPLLLRVVNIVRVKNRWGRVRSASIRYCSIFSTSYRPYY